MHKATGGLAREYRQILSFGPIDETATIFTEIAENATILPKRPKTLQNAETA